MEDHRALLPATWFFTSWLMGFSSSICSWHGKKIMEHDHEKIINMKLILYIFEQLFGLKINVHKGQIFVLIEQRMRSSTTCSYLATKLPLYLSPYLGVHNVPKFWVETNRISLNKKSCLLARQVTLIWRSTCVDKFYVDYYAYVALKIFLAEWWE